jgi:hypothetical protein
LSIPEDRIGTWLDGLLPGALDQATNQPLYKYANGMLVSDPLYDPVMESGDPQTVVEWLTQAGYRSASLTIDWTGGTCNMTDGLDVLEPCFEHFEAATRTTEAQYVAATEAAQLSVTMCLAQAAPGGPATPPTTWGPWVARVARSEPKNATPWQLSSLGTVYFSGAAQVRVCDYTECATVYRTRSRTFFNNAGVA